MNYEQTTKKYIYLEPKLLRESQKVTPVETRDVVRLSAPEAQEL